MGDNLPYVIRDEVFRGVKCRMKVYPHGVAKMATAEEMAVWDRLQAAEQELAELREQAKPKGKK